MKKILIVEDDYRLAKLTQAYLCSHDYHVDLHGRGNNTEDRVRSLKPDLVILDVMLPDKSGFEICRSIRPWYDGFIIIMTASDEDIDEIVGLEIGADDYLAKPVEPRLLLARIRALLRRKSTTGCMPAAVSPEKTSSQIQGVNGLIINADNRKVLLNEIEVDFTTAEFDLLHLLASNAGHILSRDDIFSQLRGIDFDGIDRSIDARISRLRRKLLDNPDNPSCIKTVRGKGYLFLKEE